MPVFNPSLCGLLPFNLVLCCCFKVQGRYSGFQVIDWLNEGKKQNPQKSLDQNLTPKKSHAEFPSHKNFQKALNDFLAQNIETLVLNTPKNPYLNQATPPPQKKRKLPNFPTLPKSRKLKISNPKNFFDHLCHLKSGVNPCWVLRPFCLLEFFPNRASISPHVLRKSKVVLGSGFQSLSVELGFWIPMVSGIPHSLRGIPDSEDQDSGFHKQNYTGVWILESGFPSLGRSISTKLVIKWRLDNQLLLRSMSCPWENDGIKPGREGGEGGGVERSVCDGGRGWAKCTWGH